MFFETSSILPRTKTCQLPSALCSSDFKAKKKKIMFFRKKNFLCSRADADQAENFL